MKHAREATLATRWSDDEDEGETGTMCEGILTSLSCCQCGVVATPQWREGPQGPKTLCNACGVKYYRSQQSKSKQSKKTGAGSSGKAAKGRRRKVQLLKSSAGRDSWEEAFAHSPAMSDNSEESEEHVAALSLLFFAGVQPVDGLLGRPDPPESLAMDTVVFDQAAAKNIMNSITACLPGQDLLLLQQMQASLQQAYVELQAADAATLEMAQFLNEKKVQATSARERAHSAAQLLLEEMRLLEKQYALSEVLFLPGKQSEGIVTEPVPGS